MVKFSGKLQLNSGKAPKSLDSTEMKFWVTPPGKDPKEMRCLLRTKGVFINAYYIHMTTAEMRL